MRHVRVVRLIAVVLLAALIGCADATSPSDQGVTVRTLAGAITIINGTSETITYYRVSPGVLVDDLALTSPPECQAVNCLSTLPTIAPGASVRVSIGTFSGDEGVRAATYTLGWYQVTGSGGLGGTITFSSRAFGSWGR